MVVPFMNLPNSRGRMQVEMLEARQMLAANLTITEFMARNDGFHRDGDNRSPDWIELFNAGDTALDLQGYRLTDNRDEQSFWTFPSVTLDASKYLVVFASGQEGSNFVDSQGNLHTTFGLKADGEYLALLSPDGTLLSQYGSQDSDYPPQRSNISYGLAQTVPLVQSDSDTFYKVPFGPEDDSTWTSSSFDELAQGFAEGKLALGTEDNPNSRSNLSGEIVTELPTRAHGVYTRTHFQVDDSADVSQLTLQVKYDNGFVAYLNGQRVASDNAPDNPSWFTKAPESRPRDRDAVKFVDFDISEHRDKLVDGDNVLAFHGLNHIPQDQGDLLLAAQLKAVVPSLTQAGYMPEPTPGAANTDAFDGLVADTKFSVDRGFFDTPQSVEITTETEGAQIYYTTDGSEPVPSNSEAMLYTEAVVIDETTVLRAAAHKAGFLSTNTDTQTFIFVDDVSQQSVMKSVITEDPIWGPKVRDSLLSVPTISLTTATRIREGQQIPDRVELPASVELILPDGAEGFQIDAGLEHWGGHTLGNSNKKNMRLSFKGIYGATSLQHDLFGEGATTEFDQLLLRTGSHDNWFWTHPAGKRGVYLRNPWASDRQLEMGQPAPRGRFVQVYINGVYWGMHNLMERPNAAFMASYFGGEKEDYDALNAGSAIDGTLDAWRDLQTAARGNDYEALQNYLDVENYADYMLLNFYGGNDWDWNASQNWAGARPREDGAGYVFFAWDNDLLLRTTLNANVINRGGPGNLWRNISKFAEFRMLLADRAYQYFFNDGMLTPERVFAQFDALEDEVRMPLIAETARWSGTNGTPAYTPDTWQTHIDLMRDDIIAGRTEVVVDQLRRAGFYPHVEPPIAQIDGQPRFGGLIAEQEIVQLSAPDGAILYTLDGSDPRAEGGDVSPKSIVYARPFSITPGQTLKARALADGEWSPLQEVSFQQQSNIPLRITEVNYSPHSPNHFGDVGELDSEADAFEFIELMNTSSDPIDLGGVRLVESSFRGQNHGVSFAFSAQTLAPMERIVVVRDQEAFVSRYGTSMRLASGSDGDEGESNEFGGTLSNSGEQLTLLDSEDGVIQQFTYGTSKDWPTRAKGLGSSLELIDAYVSPDSATNWKASEAIGGTPGTAPMTRPPIVINEVLANTAVEFGDRIELHNVSADTVDVGSWIIRSSARPQTAFQLSPTEQIPGGAYLTIDQQKLGFDIDGLMGDTIQLVTANQQGHFTAFVDEVNISPALEGITLGRLPNGSGSLVPMSHATFGQTNASQRVPDVVISEIHFNPEDPDGNRSLRPRDFKFVELHNTTDQVVSLDGWRLTGSAELTFSAGDELEPGESAAVTRFSPTDTKKPGVFQFVLGAPITQKFFGAFKGDRLPDDEGTLILEASLGQAGTTTAYAVVDQASYGSQAPWPAGTAGQGASIQRLQPLTDGLLPSSWVAEIPTPGSVEFVTIREPGDSNEDGIFNQLDIVQILQAGKYLSGQPASFAEGDWNEDGFFDQLDLVAALQAGTYLRPDAAVRGLVMSASESVTAIDQFHAEQELSGS